VDTINDRSWRHFHETCPPVVHIAEVTSPGQPDDHVLTIRACDSPISRRHVYTSRAHRVIVALMTSSRKNPLHLFVQFQGASLVRLFTYLCIYLLRPQGGTAIRRVCRDSIGSTGPPLGNGIWRIEWPRALFLVIVLLPVLVGATLFKKPKSPWIHIGSG